MGCSVNQKFLTLCLFPDRRAHRSSGCLSSVVQLTLHGSVIRLGHTGFRWHARRAGMTHDQNKSAVSQVFNRKGGTGWGCCAVGDSTAAE